MDNDHQEERSLPGLFSRRQFLSYMAAMGAAGVTALSAIPVLGYLLSPLLRQPQEVWRNVGPADQFEIGKTVPVAFLDAAPVTWAGVAAQTAAWLRRVDDTHFIAFSVNCTHLGCPIRWHENANLFICPCHGGVFDGNGNPSAGPVRQPLASYPTRVRDGQVEILTSPLPLAR
jgi:menaquinol-cytochrome c reductase iron-sulfur subunit